MSIANEICFRDFCGMRRCAFLPLEVGYLSITTWNLMQQMQARETTVENFTKPDRNDAANGLKNSCVGHLVGAKWLGAFPAFKVLVQLYERLLLSELCCHKHETPWSCIWDSHPNPTDRELGVGCQISQGGSCTSYIWTVGSSENLASRTPTH